MSQKIILPVKGMHCTACEILTERELQQVDGVTAVKSNHHSGEIEVEYSDQKPDTKKLAQAIEKSGYQLGQDSKAWLSADMEDYTELAYAMVIFLVIYLAYKFSGLDAMVSLGTGAEYSMPMVLLVGLTAGLSTCMALVGGLILALTANYAKAHPRLSAKKKFMPHLVFNAGRVLGYAVLGGVLGALGSAFKMSVSFNGWLVLVVAVVMIWLGLKLLKIFPVIQSWDITLPKSVSKWLPSSNQNSKYSHYQTMLLGALTFFVPCGFTQAMQVFALSSGSAVSGAMIMGVFAIGTAPGLLGLGGLVAVIKGRAAGIFYRLAGIAVLVFAIFNLGNGYNLVKAGGVDLLAWLPKEQQLELTSEKLNDEGMQVIEMTQSNRGYSPKYFKVKVNQPVKWIITSTNARSCASALVVPKLKITKQLTAGENIIEFTPTEVGMINFSCSMGMYSGSIEVVADDAVVAPKENSETRQGQVEGIVVEDKVVTETKNEAIKSVVEKVVAKSSVKVLRATYNNIDGMVPYEFEVNVGDEVLVEVLATEDGRGCMSTIMVPGYDDSVQDLLAGQTAQMKFTADKVGRIKIACAMNVPHGFITVK